MNRAAGRCLLAAICAAAFVGTAAPSLREAEPALAQAGPALTERAAALIDERTGQPLYLYAADRELAIASTTKLMTALLTLERVHRLSIIFKQNDFQAAAEDSQIGLVPGERMSAHDLLLALLLPSADDAAEDLAYNVGHHSVGRFVGMMNVRARELGLTHTHYSTPSGLDTPGNYSTAADLVKLARYVMLHEAFFARVVALPRATLRTGAYVRHVTNRNALVGHVPWINGVKTGHTADAGYVLVGSGTRDGLTLVSAVLGTSSESTRDARTLALLNWGFANFHIVRPIRAGEVLARPSVRDQPGRPATVIASRGVTALAARSSRVTMRARVPDQLEGPLNRRTIVGTAVVRDGNRTLATIPLVLARAIPAVSPLTLAARFITRPFTLVLIVFLVVAAVAVVLRLRTRARESRIAGREPA